jgi:hypothetical protein
VGSQVNLRERMAAIDANIDDVQAGAEASSRVANTLIADTGKFNGLLKGPLLRTVMRDLKALQACGRDQRTALQELRNSVARLREELHLAKRAVVRPPSLSVADRERQ